MQLNQPRPVAPQPPMPSDLAVLTAAPRIKAPIEAKRVQRDDRATRFGPLPGEVFADEARFGSFS